MEMRELNTPLRDAAGENSDGGNSDTDMDTVPEAEPALPTSQSYRSGRVRFFALITQSCMMFGSYYFFDQLSGIGVEGLHKYGIKISQAEFGALQGVYSFPNIVLPLFGGLLLDRIGIKNALVVLFSIVVLGQCIFSIGICFKSFAVMLIGQLVFGIGGESLSVASSTLVALWFRNREMAFAMGTTITISRIGSAVAFQTQPILAERFGLNVATWCGFFIVCFGFCCSLACSMLEKRADAVDKLRGISGVRAEIDRVSLAFVKQFSVKFWLVAVSCVTVYVSVFPFLKVTVIPFIMSHLPPASDSAVTAGLIASSITITSAVCSPITGLLVDRVGWRPFWICLCAAILAVMNIVFAVYPKCETSSCEDFLALAIGFVGLPLALYGSAMWTIVPFVVNENAIGTGFGLITAVQNLGLCLAPVILSSLQPIEGTAYGAAFAFIVLCDVAGLFCGLALWRLDAREGGRLMLSSVPREDTREGGRLILSGVPRED